jgi:hypothetical protein
MAGLDAVEYRKLLASAGNRTLAVQPVAHRYISTELMYIQLNDIKLVSRVLAVYVCWEYSLYGNVTNQLTN